MDVGCGTGILSIFCAQAGAKRVRYRGVIFSFLSFEVHNVVSFQSKISKLI